MKVLGTNKKTGLDTLKEGFFSRLIPVDKSITETLPYKKVLKDGTVVTKEDTYQAFLKVKTTDLTSISDDGFVRLVNKFTYLNRVYLDDYKILSLTYPTETVEQGIYWQHKVTQAKRALYTNKEAHLEDYLKWNLKLAYDNLSRVDFVSTLPELTFSFVVYGKTKRELKNHVDIMKQAGGIELGLKVQTKEEVNNIIRKLMNMNSPI